MTAFLLFIGVYLASVCCNQQQLWSGANRINNSCGNMKSNCYASIDAHIISCKLHHHNNVSYSVALKLGKNQQVASPFKIPKDLVIDMDTHLTLQTDKHTYEQFPKLTLIVSVMGENQERKTVGTTFANFRKEGVQTFKVSECSCKDKAFEVDISFSCKIEAKNSNNPPPKKNGQGSPQANYLSQQVTPRQSRELYSQLPIAQGPPGKKGSPVKEGTLHQVRSQKVLGRVKESQISPEDKRATMECLRGEIAALIQKVASYESEIQDLKRYKKMLFEEQINSEKWFELLKLQEERNSLAISHILSLEEMILSLMPKCKSIRNASSSSFRVIEEEDEIMMINEELQSELEKERTHNKILEMEIDSLKNSIEVLTERLKQNENLLKRKEKAKQSSKIKSSIVSAIECPNQIMITSRVQEKKATQERAHFLEMQLQKLEKQYVLLKSEVQKMEDAKKILSKDTKSKTEGRRTTMNIPTKHEEGKKTERVTSKEKASKPQPARTTKRNTTTGSVAAVPAKKPVDITKSRATADKKTKVSSESESKTEGESFNKSSEIGVNQMKSQSPKPVVSEAFYMGNTFQEVIQDF